MVPDPDAPSWESIKAVCEEVLSSQSCERWGDFKREVAKRLQVEVGSLKSWKSEMQEIIVSADKGKGEGEDGEISAGNSNKGEDNHRKRRSENERKSRAKSEPDGIDDSAAMKALKRMVQAMKCGPSIWRNVKQMGSKEAEKKLRLRLIQAGAQIKGEFPSSHEIEQARRKVEKERDLEGIDVSNVLEGSRRRGRADIIPQAKKKQRRSSDTTNRDHKTSEGKGLSSTKSGGDSSEDEESEAEFEL